MWKLGVLGMMLVTGCVGRNPDAGYLLELDIQADPAIDQLVFLGAWTSMPGTGPITPAQLALGVDRGEPATIVPLTWIEPEPIAAGTHTHRLVRSYLAPVPREVLLLGYRRDSTGKRTLVSAAHVSNLPRSGEPLTVDLDPRLLATLEVWGSTDRPCARFIHSARYFTLGDDDDDCDGFVDAEDCDDGRHCDPDAATPEGRAGCETSTCQPCLLATPGGCAIGTQAVCHDVPGAPRAYTCEAGGCGEPTCLPASACELPCAVPWPNTDPIGCLTSAWWNGAQSADAIHCRLPVRDEYLCTGGSAIELSLPFTDCANPEVLVGSNMLETATATIAPPCTLRVTLTPIEPAAVFSRPALVTFETGATSASARFMLDPAPDTCGTIGSCDAVTTSATCQL